MYKIRILSATGLPAADKNGKSDPYVIVFAEGLKKYRLGKTRCIKENVNPVWNTAEDTPFVCPMFRAKKMNFEIIDRNAILKDVPIGEASYDLKNVVFGSEIELPVREIIPGNGNSKLKIQIDFDPAQYPKSEISSKSAILYAFLNFESPYEGNTCPAELQLGCININGQAHGIYPGEITENMTVLYDQDNEFKTRNGRTRVFRISLKRSVITHIVPIVKASDYTGKVTVEIVHVGKEKTSNGVKITEDSEAVHQLTSATIDVISKDSVTTGFALAINRSKVTLLQIPTMRLQTMTFAVLIRQITNELFKNGEKFKPRNYIRLGTVFSLSEAAEKIGVGIPNKLDFCLGWDSSTDLDASVSTFNATYDCIETIYFGRLRGNNNIITHSGDNLTGAGSGDDEVITINLGMLPEDIKVISIQITSYRGVPFTNIRGAFLRLVDGDSKNEIMYLTMSNCERKTGLFFAMMYRINAEQWDLFPVCRYFDANTPSAINQPITQFLRTSGFVEEMLATIQ